MENKNVLAKINGVEITDEIVDRTIEQFPEDKKAYFSSDMGRRQLIDQLINVELVNAYGAEIGIQEDEMYRSQMEQAEKDIRFGVTMGKIMNDVKVEEGEAKARYDQDPSAFGTGETLRASHILVDSEEKAKEIKAKLDGGELSFEDAAKEYSSCPSKENGGDLGAFGKGMMVPEFEEAAWKAPLNEVTEPVKTQFGYHLIKATEKNEASQEPFEHVKAEIEMQLLQEKQVARFQEKIAELKDKYFDK